MNALPAKRRGAGAAVLALVWAASALYVAGFVRRGWIPLDEGTTALAAERVLHGELAHRDFEGAYTGGLSHLHALAFELLGIRLVSLRVVLFVSFLAFVPAVYGVARRFWEPMPAGAVTLLAAAWSVPNYFAGMPSWYNLFFAVFGTLAALRFVRTNSRAWLFAAGLCVGLSVLVKITGLYFGAALLLFLAHAARAQPEPEREAPERRPLVFAVFLAACGSALVLFLLVLIRRRPAPMELLHFVAPAAGLCGYLVWYEARAGRGSSAARFRALLSLLLPAAAGVLLPIGVFLVPYAASGSLRSLAEGLATNTLRQLGNTKSMMYLPPFEAFWAAIPYLAVLALPRIWPRRRRTLWTAALAAALALVLAATDRAGVYRRVWLSAQSVAVVAVLAGCRFLFQAPESDLPASRRLELFLLLCVTAMVSLIQFPFAAPHYFYYVAPAAGLAVAALVASDRFAPRSAHGAVLGFYLGFAIWRLNPAYVFTVGHHPERYRADHLLALPRGGLLVPEADGLLYEELVAAIWSVDPGPFLFAGPDCPEVYFLSGRKSPMPVFMDFQGPLYERPGAILRLLEARQIQTIVINRAPTFSRPIRGELLAELERRFPNCRRVGRFEVRWAGGLRPPSL